MKILGIGLVLLSFGMMLLPDKVRFRQQKISNERFESAGVFDVNGDKKPDIVSGEWWYEGPDFKTRHFMGKVRAEGEYYDDFSTIPMDVNGDGRMDFVTGGWWGQTLKWKENPGDPAKEWPEHLIDTCGYVETTRAWDIDQDGTPEIVPNNPMRSFKFYRLVLDEKGKGTGRFTKHVVYPRQGHGLGFGDVNGDGKGDFICPDGWFECPNDPFKDTWKFHHEFSLGTASIPVLVVDVNNDGLNDLITGEAHDYGLNWFEQRKVGDRSDWKKHSIDSTQSQYHEMHWRDITGDGKPELITGKRFRAHMDQDPGSNDPYGIYYFTWNGTKFDKHPIIFGPPGKTKGTGIYMAIEDLNGDGRPDLVAPGKDGLSVFWNAR